MDFRKVNAVTVVLTSVFSEFSSKKLLVIQFFIMTMHSVSFSIWCDQMTWDQVRHGMITGFNEGLYIYI